MSATTRGWGLWVLDPPSPTTAEVGLHPVLSWDLVHQLITTGQSLSNCPLPSSATSFILSNTGSCFAPGALPRQIRL